MATGSTLIRPFAFLCVAVPLNSICGGKSSTTRFEWLRTEKRSNVRCSCWLDSPTATSSSLPSHAGLDTAFCLSSSEPTGSCFSARTIALTSSGEEVGPSSGIVIPSKEVPEFESAPRRETVCSSENYSLISRICPFRAFLAAGWLSISTEALFEYQNLAVFSGRQIGSPFSQVSSCDTVARLRYRISGIR